MAWLPAARGAVVSVAAPPAPTVPAPRTTDPSRNVTVPVGAPTPGARAVTTAVKVTGWLAVGGLADAARVMPVEALVMVSGRWPELGEGRVLPPSEAAVGGWGPVGRGGRGGGG